MVYIHSADNLNSDTTQCNPYCMLFNNRKKVKAIYIIVEYFYSVRTYAAIFMRVSVVVLRIFRSKLRTISAQPLRRFGTAERNFSCRITLRCR